MTLEDPWELELQPLQDQLLEVLTLEQQDFYLDLSETPWSEPAYWEGPAELVEVEDASMSLVLEVLGLVWKSCNERTRRMCWSRWSSCWQLRLRRLCLRRANHWRRFCSTEACWHTFACCWRGLLRKSWLSSWSLWILTKSFMDIWKSPNSTVRRNSFWRWT